MPRTSSNSTPGLDLVEYSPRTFRASGRKAERDPLVLVSRSGRISFNRKALELMGAVEGQCAVTLLQDSRRPRDWYLRPGEGGFPFRIAKGYGLFQHAALAARILDSLSFQGKQLRIRMAGPTPPRRNFCVIDGGGPDECRNNQYEMTWK